MAMKAVPVAAAVAFVGLHEGHTFYFRDGSVAPSQVEENATTRQIQKTAQDVAGNNGSTNARDLEGGSSFIVVLVRLVGDCLLWAASASPSCRHLFFSSCVRAAL